MKRLMTLICIILALSAPTAHADNLLDKLKAAAKKAEQEKAIQYQSAADAANPIVLTVDGISPIKKNQRLETSYLKPAVDGWALSNDVSFFGWSGDFRKTESELPSLESTILAQYNLASSEGRPFVMVTHSWGTVLSYRALKNLYSSGRLPENAVHTLVTLGSPLAKATPNSQAVSPYLAVEGDIAGAVNEFGDWEGPQALSDVVASWRNYWIKRDQISSPITGAATNPATSYIGFNAHKAYYTAPSISAKIRTDLISDLEKFVSPVTIVASTDAVVPRNQTAAKSSSSDKQSGKYCLSGVCIGDSARLYDVKVSVRSSDGQTHMRPVAELKSFCDYAGPIVNEIKLDNGKQLEVLFGGTATPSGWQGYKVVGIKRVYSDVVVTQLEDWTTMVLAKFPGAVEDHGIRYYNFSDHRAVDRVIEQGSIGAVYSTVRKRRPSTPILVLYDRSFSIGRINARQTPECVKDQEKPLSLD